MKILHLIAFLSILLTVQSCKKEEDSFCTEEFATINVKVTGKTLTDFYTIRKSTNDTLKIGNKHENYYPIIDDSYSKDLKGKREYFYFIGKIGNKEVINETYLISANECHIFLVQGKETIEL